jgi:hypothetical protein
VIQAAIDEVDGVLHIPALDIKKTVHSKESEVKK